MDIDVYAREFYPLDGSITDIVSVCCGLVLGRFLRILRGNVDFVPLVWV
jgi:hypothetical protein